MSWRSSTSVTTLLEGGAERGAVAVAVGRALVEQPGAQLALLAAGQRAGPARAPRPAGSAPGSAAPSRAGARRSPSAPRSGCARAAPSPRSLHSRTIQGPSSSATPTPVASTTRPRPPMVDSTPPDANSTPSPTTRSTPPPPARQSRPRGAVLLVGAGPHEPEADGRQHARPTPRPAGAPARLRPNSEHRAEGERARARRPARPWAGGPGGGGRRRGPRRGAAPSPTRYSSDAEAVGEGEHHEGEAHDVRVDAEVAADARRPRRPPPGRRRRGRGPSGRRSARCVEADRAAVAMPWSSDDPTAPPSRASGPPLSDAWPAGCRQGDPRL